MHMVASIKARQLFFALACLAALALPRAARADYPVPIATIQCDAFHNRALIRFYIVDSDDPLPPAGRMITPDAMEYVESAEVPDSVLRQWASIPFQLGGTCRLADGKQIEVAVYQGMAGMGEDEGVPDAYFKLKIGEVMAYDGMTFFRAFANPNPHLSMSAVVYNGASLLQCVPAAQDANGAAIPGSVAGCVDVSGRLAPGERLLTDEEKAASRADRLKDLLTREMTPFCARIEKAVAPGSDAERNMISFGDGAIGVSTVQSIDIRNIGKPDQVYQVSGGDDFFNGAFLMVFENDWAGAAKFAADMQRDGPDAFFDDPDDYALKQWGGHFISVAPKGGVVAANLSFRYLQNDLVAFENKFYVYSTDADPNSVPAGIISRLTADNRIETVCQFP